MHRFTNILFCPIGDKDNPVAARRIADLAARNHAKLTLFGVVAEPSLMQRALHRDSYIEAVQDAERKAVAAKLARCVPKAGDVPSATRIVVGSPARSIIEQVLVGEHDLVVVTSDEGDHATIKQLLRKCPCPVWVIRPTRARTQRVLVAVNPDPAEAELNRNILELAVSMVGLYGGELHVVHAWELYGQSTMRSSAFLHPPASEIEALVESSRIRHQDALTTLLVEAGVAEEPWQIHLVQGRPADVVQDIVARYRINVLVMGTVARTGVPGLVMGNTAETVLDRVRCSVIATKAPGFVSPLDPAAS